MALKQLLFRLNPWWSSKTEAPLPQGIIKRTRYIQEITQFMDKPEILLLTGVRRSGKTTLLYMLIQSLLAGGVAAKNILYVSADDPEITSLLKSDFLPEILRSFQEIRGQDLKETPIYIFLDEIQYLENWQRWLKKYYDQTKIKFILSGSSATLIKDSAVYLTGRKIEINIWPLSFKETIENKFNISLKNVDLLSKSKILALYDEILPLAEKISILLPEYVRRGGFPRIQTALDPEREKILKEYFDDILYKDIIKIFSIKDPIALENIATYLMENIGQKFSYRKISKITEIDVETVKKYIHYLAESRLFHLVSYFSGSAKGSIQKEKKIYLADSGIRNVFSLKEAGGSIIENLVFSQLLAKGHDLSYWQTKEGFECDFIIRKAKIPIEVKYSDQIDPKDLRGMFAFMKRYNKPHGIVLTKNTLNLENEAFFMPVWFFCLI